MKVERSGVLRLYLPELAVLITLVAAPLVLPYLGFSTDLLTRVLNWGLIGLGFDILFGLTGLLSFGQAAFYGVGGFVTAYLLVSGTLGSVWLAQNGDSCVAPPRQRARSVFVGAPCSHRFAPAILSTYSTVTGD